jgi:hypothetical protein
LLFAATRFATSAEDEIKDYLNSAEYREVGLSEAHELGHEVMLYCEKYIAIPRGILEPPSSPLGSPIIMPG